ncbi:MAG TPA: arginine repressor [Candidatus Saccharimonadales bacterium]|nr:arginine repressor [Candidatus Saccharimonadales bacterium]
MSKLSRQNLILDLVQQESVANQEQLRKLLLRQGFDVTQATLSRDINELSLVKMPGGYRVSNGDQQAEPGFHSAGRLVREFVIEVREAQNLLVIKTATGSAQPVAAAIDSEGWAEIVGTVAGDDTILVISQSKKNAHRMALRIKGMMQ